MSEASSSEIHHSGSSPAATSEQNQNSKPTRSSAYGRQRGQNPGPRQPRPPRQENNDQRPQQQSQQDQTHEQQQSQRPQQQPQQDQTHEQQQSQQQRQRRNPRFKVERLQKTGEQPSNTVNDQLNGENLGQEQEQISEKRDRGPRKERGPRNRGGRFKKDRDQSDSQIESQETSTSTQNETALDQSGVRPDYIVHDGENSSPQGQVKDDSETVPKGEGNQRGKPQERRNRNANRNYERRGRDQKPNKQLDQNQNQNQNQSDEQLPQTQSSDIQPVNSDEKRRERMMKAKEYYPRSIEPKQIPKRDEDTKKKQRKEELSDLVRTLSSRLTKGTYECMVCYDKIGKNASVWSCNNCYAVFHLTCVKEWSQKSGKESGWRCPGCQHTQITVPSDYRCFCGKLSNPKWDPYFTPHSCGDICGKKRAGTTCPHPCTLACHPGPCPPCGSFSPISNCFCGKTSYRLKCGETDNGKSCDNTCGRTLNCQKHSCLKNCHSGECGNCTHSFERQCYCGKTTKSLFCGLEDQFEEGYFACEEICGKDLACGNHKCMKKCHKGPCGDCPLLPTIITSCPCGSTKLKDLNTTRISCNDPIPTCQKKCSKPLSCISNLLGLDENKHFCQQTCHTGECPPCQEQVKIHCVCGNSSQNVVCGTQNESTIANFKCQKVCKIQRHCGRHLCGIVCCPSRGKFSELHECPNICQKKLRCGKHFCQLPCHRGPCPSCLQASFDELSCPCGMTKIYPPVPCSAVLPPCRHPCSRPHPCGHPPSHNCHTNDTCPPCNILAPKQCGCSRKLVVMTPCYRKEGNCGRICGAKLKCGHPCSRICHTGECDDGSQVCKNQCGKKKKCGHPCRANCHFDSPCPNNTCQDLVAISCNCGRKVERIVCGEGDQRLVGAKLPQPKKSLECDEECRREERNRRLADALDIQPETHRKEAEYPKTLFEFCNKNLEFVKRAEVTLREFLFSDKKVFNFPPMKGDQRAFIHELCAFYDFKSESVDQEPRRSVIIRKTLNSREPTNLLSETFKRGDWINLESANANIVVKMKRTARRFQNAVNAIIMYGVDPLVQVEEMREVVKQFISIGFDIAKLAPTTIVILPDNPWKDDLDRFEAFLDDSLQTLKKELSSVFTSINCCWVNQDHEVTVESVIDYTKRKNEAASTSKQEQKDQPESGISVIKNPFDLLEETDIEEESKISKDPWEEPGKQEVAQSHEQENSLTDSWEHVDVQPEQSPTTIESPPTTSSQYIVDEIDVPSDWTSLLPEDD